MVRGGYYWRKPGEDLEILEKTWSSKINIFIAKLSQSPSFQFLISGGCVDTMDPTSFTATLYWEL